MIIFDQRQSGEGVYLTSLTRKKNHRFSYLAGPALHLDHGASLLGLAVELEELLGGGEDVSHRRLGNAVVGHEDEADLGEGAVQGSPDI